MLSLGVFILILTYYSSQCFSQRSTGSCVLRVMRSTGHAFYWFMRSTGSCVLRVHAFYGFRHSRVYVFLGLCANAYTSPTQTFSPTRGLTFADVTFSFLQGIFTSKSDSLGAAVTIIISRINNSLSLRFHVPLSQASATHVPESPVYLRPAND